MTERKNDGGPAFPTLGRELTDMTGAVVTSGMSLRDAFALAALAGMHARNTFDEGQATPYQRAMLAYIDADAMLVERDRTS